MSSAVWGPERADMYDSVEAEMFDPAVLGPAVDVLSELAEGGPVLEFAVGTGRVALPLAAKGIPMSAIELSPHMAAKLAAKPRAESVSVTIGDMTSTRVPGQFRLVYLVFNAIMDLTTQDEQAAVFVNAAHHLEPGGRFVVEVFPPHALRHMGSVTRPQVSDIDEDRIVVDTVDPVRQICCTHEWCALDGRLVDRAGRATRYVYPSELDLMARLAGMRVTDRWGGWHREPFVPTSTNQVAVFQKATTA